MYGKLFVISCSSKYGKLGMFVAKIYKTCTNNWNNILFLVSFGIIIYWNMFVIILSPFIMIKLIGKYIVYSKIINSINSKSIFFLFIYIQSLIFLYILQMYNKTIAILLIFKIIR